MENNKIWNLFLAGQSDALSSIFIMYHDDLFNYGMKLSSNSEIVKDAIQDLFLKLWKNRNNLHSIEVIKPYLLKSLRNHIYDTLQLIKPCQSIQESHEDSVFEITYSHEDFLIHQHDHDKLNQQVIETINRLTPRQREVIYLRFFEGLSFETIAQVMDMNLQSVRNTLHRGMQSMRELMVLPAFLMMIGKVCAA